MTTAAYAARAYASDGVSTASPARLLLMLLDRLVRDLLVAEQALTDRDLAVASENLTHAQAILSELNTSLDVEAWDGGPALSALYLFMHSELVQANLTKDVARVATVRDLVEPLRDTWREAALLAASGPAWTATP